MISAKLMRLVKMPWSSPCSLLWTWPETIERIAGSTIPVKAYGKMMAYIIQPWLMSPSPINTKTERKSPALAAFFCPSLSTILPVKAPCTKIPCSVFRCWNIGNIGWSRGKTSAKDTRNGAAQYQPKKIGGKIHHHVIEAHAQNWNQ